MSADGLAPSNARQSPAYRDFRWYRRRLSRHLASLKSAGLDEAKNIRLSHADQFEMPSNLLMAGDYIEQQIALCDARMEHGGEEERSTVAETIRLLAGILGLMPSTARLVEMAGSSVTRDRSEEAARRATGMTVAMIAAAEKVRGVVQSARRDPTQPDWPQNPGTTWNAMRRALGRSIDDKTARTYWRYCIDNPPPRPESI